MGRDLHALLTRLLALCNAAFAAVAAILGIACWLNPSGFAPAEAPPPPPAVFAQLGEGPVRSAAFFGAFLLAANIAWLIYGRAPRRPLRYIVSEGRSGPIRIAREALVSGLQKAGEDLDEVSRVRVTIDQAGRRRIHVQASFQVPDGVSVQDAGQRLRSTLAGAFFDLVNLGADRRLDVSIEFTGRSGRLAKKREDDETRPEEEEERPFTGPQYPIDDQDDPFRDRP